ncbi:hypothetical protein [Dietzia cinnamea]|uniref:hypothetical protein n=1 Tax=Dietzia cinnamea TaxID=321318 RepID=UPI00223B649E|nr:hypothetical protein [Dietzia cinnamea]MCT2077508.1 hypothetical protein [Dietzia cinnamea]MCT2219807.1 hypothetical protein [Dietzia cinnamea]
MAYTVQCESFQEVIVKERTQLRAGSLAGATTLTVVSAQGIANGDVILVGTPGLDGCERAVVSAVASETQLTLVDELKLPHAAYDALTALKADRVRVYRASDLLNNPPEASAAWTVLGERELDVDQLSTYYSDPEGGDAFWYRYTYVDTADTFESIPSVPVRGTGYRRYCSIREIREEAGFLNAVNLRDTLVEQQRRAAEAEINAVVSGIYGAHLPFDPVPEIVRTLTIQLAAGLLLLVTFGEESQRGNELTKSVRTRLKAIAAREETIDIPGELPGGTTTVNFWPDETAPRAFRMDQRF